MTKKVRELKREKQKEIAKAIAEYEQQVRVASEDLKIEKAAICQVYDCCIEKLGKPERTNHLAHAKATAHAFMRHVDHAAKTFQPDAKEFEINEGGAAIFPVFSQHFDVCDDKVVFTLTCEMKRKNNN